MRTLLYPYCNGTEEWYCNGTEVFVSVERYEISDFNCRIIKKISITLTIRYENPSQISWKPSGHSGTSEVKE